MLNKPTVSVRKRPNDAEKLNASYLGSLATSEKITDSMWDVPVGLSTADGSNTANTAGITVSGGTDGVNYTVTNQVTTDKGRTLSRQFQVEIRAY